MPFTFCGSLCWCFKPRSQREKLNGDANPRVQVHYSEDIELKIEEFREEKKVLQRRIADLELELSVHKKPGTTIDQDTLTIRLDSIIISPNDAQNWMKLETLGRGGHSIVYSSVNINSGKMVALKEINIQNLSHRDHLKVTREIEMLETFQHPMLVKMYGFVINETICQLYLEHVDGYSIESLYRKIGGLSESLITHVMSQLLDALCYLHGHGVIHKDLKGKNCMLMSNGMLKLIDLGSATYVNHKENEMAEDWREAHAEDLDVTPLWVAPEILLQRPFTEKADIWSLGCTIVEMRTGAYPWAKKGFKNTYTAVYQIANTDEIPCIPSELNVSPEMADFLNHCLQRDETKRKSAEELCNHDFITHLVV